MTSNPRILVRIVLGPPRTPTPDATASNRRILVRIVLGPPGTHALFARPLVASPRSTIAIEHHRGPPWRSAHRAVGRRPARTQRRRTSWPADHQGVFDRVVLTPPAAQATQVTTRAAQGSTALHAAVCHSPNVAKAFLT